MDGQWEGFHLDGNKKYLVTYSNAKKNGYYVRYFRKGMKEMEGTFKDDERDQEWTFYYDMSDSKYRVGSYLKGKMEGTWKTYFREGGEMLEENYKNGRLEGDYIRYYMGGQVEFKCNYTNGLKHGTYILYTKEGEVHVKKRYKFNQEVKKK